MKSTIQFFPKKKIRAILELKKSKKTNENIESKQKQKTKATFRACLKEKNNKTKIKNIFWVKKRKNYNAKTYVSGSTCQSHHQ